MLPHVTVAHQSFNIVCFLFTKLEDGGNVEVKITMTTSNKLTNKSTNSICIETMNIGKRARLVLLTISGPKDHYERSQRFEDRN